MQPNAAMHIRFCEAGMSQAIALLPMLLLMCLGLHLFAE